MRTTLLDDPGADDLLLQRAERLLDLAAATGELAGSVVAAHEGGDEPGLDLVEAGVAVVLVGDEHRLAVSSLASLAATASKTSGW